MKYIIITTLSDADIWKTAVENGKWNVTESLLEFNEGDIKAQIYLQRDKNNDFTDIRVEEIGELITKSSPEDRFHIAAHGATYDRLNEVAEFWERPVVLHLFTHDKPETNKTHKVIFELAKNPGPDTFTAACEDLEKKIEPRILFQVQHRLSRILTPIVLDVQGLEESSFDEDYWREIVHEHRNSSQTALGELRAIINENNPLIPKLAQKNLVEPVKRFIDQFIEKNELLKDFARLSENGNGNTTPAPGSDPAAAGAKENPPAGDPVAKLLGEIKDPDKRNAFLKSVKKLYDDIKNLTE